MMKLLAFSALVVVRAVDVPAVLWSSVQGETTTTKSYDTRRLAARDVGAKMTAADVSVLVVVPRASSVGLVDHFAQGRRLDTVLSVEVLPFVEAPGDASLFFEDNGEPPRYVAWDDLDDVLVSSSEQQQQTGIVTVFAPDLGVVDVADLTARLQDHCGGERSWVLGLAAADAYEPVNFRRLDDTDATPTNATYEGVRMTPDILSGILVAHLFVFTVCLGFYCIGAIQTPSHYAKKGPPSLKEW